MQSTFAALSRFCPSIATSGMIRWRAYRWISAGERVADAARSPRRSNMGGVIAGAGGRGSAAGRALVRSSPGSDQVRSGQAAGLIPADQEAGVVAAEAEAVRHDAVDPGLAGDVGDVVEVAPLVGVVEVDRRRDDAGVDRQRRGDQLDAAGGAEQVAELALGAGDLQPRACGPKTSFIALVSARSPRPVLVPWALM